jgi:DNA-3-methyladenine glycosylase I
MRDRGEDFSGWLWSFTGGATLQHDCAPGDPPIVSSPESIAMAKALKQKGFSFCGPVITYAFMQAVGMVNDHTTACFRHAEVRAMAEAG